MAEENSEPFSATSTPKGDHEPGIPPERLSTPPVFIAGLPEFRKGEKLDPMWKSETEPPGDDDDLPF